MCQASCLWLATANGLAICHQNKPEPAFLLTVDGRSQRLSNLGGPNSSRVLEPQGVSIADFPTGNELDAANGIVHEDAAIGINRKLVVDSLKASIPLKFLLCSMHRYH